MAQIVKMTPNGKRPLWQWERSIKARKVRKIKSYPKRVKAKTLFGDKCDNWLDIIPYDIYENIVEMKRDTEEFPKIPIKYLNAYLFSKKIVGLGAAPRVKDNRVSRGEFWNTMINRAPLFNEKDNFKRCRASPKIKEYNDIWEKCDKSSITVSDIVKYHEEKRPKVNNEWIHSHQVGDIVHHKDWKKYHFYKIIGETKTQFKVLKLDTLEPRSWVNQSQDIIYNSYLEVNESDRKWIKHENISKKTFGAINGKDALNHYRDTSDYHDFDYIIKRNKKKETWNRIVYWVLEDKSYCS
jgi:hypothetical protein